MTKRLVQAAPVAILCAVLAGPAQAAPGGDATVQPAFFLTPATRPEQRASCPPGQRITGGGIGTTADPTRAVAQVSGPLDEFDLTATTLDTDVALSWYSNVLSSVDGTAYRTYAVCSATSDALVYESTFTAPSMSDGGAVRGVPGRHARRRRRRRHDRADRQRRDRGERATRSGRLDRQLSDRPGRPVLERARASTSPANRGRTGRS